MTSAFTIVREAQLEAEQLCSECEQGLRDLLADDPARLAYSLSLLRQKQKVQPRADRQASDGLAPTLNGVTCGCLLPWRPHPFGSLASPLFQIVFYVV
jgi:hypothetical protein